MNIFEKLTFNEDRPSVLSLKKTENTNLFSVGLLEKQVLAKHITTVPATLVMMRGKIDFNINNESIVLRMGDVFEIPINVEHEVVGRDIENIFLIVKELDANP
jgi:quercetin dioxygenase-like cupin family protein